MYFFHLYTVLLTMRFPEKVANIMNKSLTFLFPKFKVAYMTLEYIYEKKFNVNKILKKICFINCRWRLMKPEYHL